MRRSQLMRVLPVFVAGLVACSSDEVSGPVTPVPPPPIGLGSASPSLSGVAALPHFLAVLRQRASEDPEFARAQAGFISDFARFVRIAQADARRGIAPAGVSRLRPLFDTYDQWWTSKRTYVSSIQNGEATITAGIEWERTGVAAATNDMSWTVYRDNVVVDGGSHADRADAEQLGAEGRTHYSWHPWRTGAKGCLRASGKTMHEVRWHRTLLPDDAKSTESEDPGHQFCWPNGDDDGTGGGGGSDDGYGSECEVCQQWFYYQDGVVVDEWWECTSIDAKACSNP